MSRAIAKLKDQARALELKEEWDRAISVYAEIIRVGEASDDVELGLFNRIGDLYLKVGKPAEAVRYYERASDLYADQGLYNNAIALCNKALRYLPNRIELLLKLGQFAAAQGFLTDARRWFLQYAEKAMKTGEMNAAFSALEEFARLSDDAEVRELLGRQLQAHGRRKDALEQLNAAYALRTRARQHEAAEALKAEILALDPNADLAGAAVGPAGLGPDDTDPYELPGFEDAPIADAAPASAPPAPAPLELEPGPGGEVEEAEDARPEGTPTADAAGIDIERTAFGDEEPPVTPAPAAGLEREPVSAAEVESPAALEGIESWGFETGSVIREEAEPEPEPEPQSESELEAEFEPESELEPEPLPLLPEPEAQAEDETPVELPFMDLGSDEPLPLLDEADEEDVVRPEPEPEEPSIESAFLEEAPAASAPEPEAAPSEPEAASELFDLDAIDFGAGMGRAGPRAPTVRGGEEVWRELELGVPAEPVAKPEEPPAELDGVEFEIDVELEDEAGPLEAEHPEQAAVWEPEPEAEAAWEPEPEPEPEPEAAWKPEPEPEPDPELSPEVVIAVARKLRREARERDALHALERGARELAQLDRLEDAVAVLTELTDVWPDDVNAQQRRVEYAFRLGRKDLLIPAYLGLATALKQSGAGSKASAVYQRLLDLDPGNVHARAALAPPPRRKPTAAPPAPPPSGFIDLGSLLAEDEPEETTRFMVPEAEPTGDEDKDFAEMLSQFKVKVSEHLSSEDWSSHYDLGLAYREMGLVDEAISEFQTALRGGGERLKVYEELGQCFIQKGRYNIAARLLTRALDMPFDEAADLVGVYYQLGLCYEALGKPDEARESYERVVSLDIAFRDVNDRLARL
jgi:tetratricopeptide (TPR) repeat protein